MMPLFVETVVDDPSVTLIVNGLAPPPELKVMVFAREVVIEVLEPKVKEGVLMLIAELRAKLVLLAICIAPEAC